MSTNYYLIKNPCPCCGKGEANLHIGSSSSGWAFALRVNEFDKSPKNIHEWHTEIFNENNKIIDEYDNAITPNNLWALIDKPNPGTLRHIEHYQVTADPKLSYDLVSYEFS